MIDVLAEEVEEAVMRLDQARSTELPFGGGDECGSRSKGRYFLHAGDSVAVDSEGDALVAEGDIGHAAAAAHRASKPMAWRLWANGR